MESCLQLERDLAGDHRRHPLHRSILPVAVMAVAGAFASAQNIEQPNSPAMAIKVDVNLVNLNVAVSDKTGHPYTSLQPESFRVYDNGVEQAIHHFSTTDVPFTMGLVLDRSGSMSMMMEEVYNAAFHTVLNSKAEDEFFIATFNEQSTIRQDFTTDQDLLKQKLREINAEGTTALWDAILGAVDHIQKGHHDKKALLVVTDGDDNSSKKPFQEVLERARRENVSIYVVGMFASEAFPMEDGNENHLKKLLNQLAEATGGRAYFPKTVQQCEQDCITIAHELRQQYTIGYYPDPLLRDSGWHRVQVKLQPTKDLEELGLTVRTRAGYYATGK